MANTKPINNDLISIDMIRLKSLVDVNYFQETINAWLLYFDVTDSPDFFKSELLGTFKKWESFKFNGYRYNFLYTDTDDTSFYFAYNHNSETTSSFNRFVVEYNPNKLGFCRFLKLVLNSCILHKGITTDSVSYTTHSDGSDSSSNVTFTKKVVKQVELVSVDICKDFALNIGDFVIDQHLKRDMTILNHGGDDKTYYIGKGHGRVKLYNKKLEIFSKTGQYIPEDNLTRFEISLNFKCAFTSVNSASLRLDLTPSISFVELDLFTNPLDKLVFLGLQESPETFKLLSRRMKEKYSKLMNCIDGTSQPLQSYQFNEDNVKLCICDYINANLTI